MGVGDEPLDEVPVAQHGRAATQADQLGRLAGGQLRVVEPVPHLLDVPGGRLGVRVQRHHDVEREATAAVRRRLGAGTWLRVVLFIRPPSLLEDVLALH